jgi:ABC-type multidrug transport system fused ATPase/permease subunit
VITWDPYNRVEAVEFAREPSSLVPRTDDAYTSGHSRQESLLGPALQSAPAVALRDVTVLYGARPALSNVTASIPCGATGLLGPNGAGKSTRILALLGLVKSNSGRIEVLGTDIFVQVTAGSATGNGAPWTHRTADV